MQEHRHHPNTLLRRFHWQSKHRSPFMQNFQEKVFVHPCCLCLFIIFHVVVPQHFYHVHGANIGPVLPKTGIYDKIQVENCLSRPYPQPKTTLSLLLLPPPSNNMTVEKQIASEIDSLTENVGALYVSKPTVSSPAQVPSASSEHVVAPSAAPIPDVSQPPGVPAPSSTAYVQQTTPATSSSVAGVSSDPVHPSDSFPDGPVIDSSRNWARMSCSFPGCFKKSEGNFHFSSYHCLDHGESIPEQWRYMCVANWGQPCGRYSYRVLYPQQDETSFQCQLHGRNSKGAIFRARGFQGRSDDFILRVAGQDWPIIRGEDFDRKTKP